MNTVFYISAVVAILSAALVIFGLNAIHALLNLIVSLLALAVIFFALGAPFIAALEVIIYAGAIMVVFVFVLMMLNLGWETTAQEREWLSPNLCILPIVLTVILIAELIYMLVGGGGQMSGANSVDAKQVGVALFGPYLLGVELASVLLLGGLVGAYHLAHRQVSKEEIKGGA